MVTTRTANLYVSEPCLNEQERDTLRHFLGRRCHGNLALAERSQ
jgi:hypothetical protein